MQSKHVGEKPDLYHPTIYVKHIEPIKMKLVMLVLPGRYVLRSCLCDRLHPQENCSFFAIRTLDLPVYHFNVRMGKISSDRARDILTYLHSSTPCIRDTYFPILRLPKCLGSGSIFCRRFTAKFITAYCNGYKNQMPFILWRTAKSTLIYIFFRSANLIFRLAELVELIMRWLCWTLFFNILDPQCASCTPSSSL